MRSVMGLLVVLMMCGCAAEPEGTVEAPPPATGPYLGQQPPGTTPELFLATGMGERDTTIYPDGDELYFSMWERSHGYLLTRTDGPDGWSEPRFAEFSAPEHPELEPFITVDGSWLFFGAAREGDLGRGDMHIAFRGPDGDFLPAVNMGAPINSASLDYCPALSPDRTILFFTSNRVPDGSPQPTTYAELEAALTGAANGRDNIWWVSADVIERLRDRVLETG